MSSLACNALANFNVHFLASMKTCFLSFLPHFWFNFVCYRWIQCIIDMEMSITATSLVTHALGIMMAEFLKEAVLGHVVFRFFSDLGRSLFQHQQQKMLYIELLKMLFSSALLVLLRMHMSQHLKWQFALWEVFCLRMPWQRMRLVVSTHACCSNVALPFFASDISIGAQHYDILGPVAGCFRSPHRIPSSSFMEQEEGFLMDWSKNLEVRVPGIGPSL